MSKDSKKKSAVSRLLEFAGAYRMQYALSVILAVSGVACALVPYFITAAIITALINGERNADFYVRYLAVAAVFWLGKAVFHALSTTCSHMATFHVLGNIRKAVCGKLAKVPLGLVKDTSSGTLKNIIVERVDSVETVLAHIVPEFTSNLLAPLCVFIWLLSIDVRMAFISLITFPLGLLCYTGMMRGYKERFSNAVSKTKILNDTAVEYINGIEVIKAFRQAEHSYEKFKVAAREGADCYIDWMRSCNVFFCIAMTLMPCTAVAVLPAGGYFMMNGTLSFPDFVMCIVLSLALLAPLITVMSYSDDIGKLRVVLGDIADILSWQELERPQESEVTSRPEGSGITLEDVRFSYREKEVIHGISIDFKEGSVNALVGPSGSGKSTLAKLIASFWDTDSGSIRIGGTDIKNIPLEEYNRMVAYVGQDNFLFDDTIRENIRMGKPGATDEEVEEVARKSGCHDFIMSLENGYDTNAGGAGSHLSGGERQRIAIARAMLKDAPVVILDEATAYTDPENEALIQASVAGLVKGKTVIVIAHRLSTIADADRIFVIQNGNAVEQGKHEELLAKGGLYSRMWKSHISVKDSAVEV